MGRPRNEIPTVTITVRLPEPARDALDELAAITGKTRSQLAAEAIGRMVDPLAAARQRHPTARLNGSSNVHTLHP